MAAPGSIQKSDEEWRAVLSPEQFRILREKGTESGPPDLCSDKWCQGVAKSLNGQKALGSMTRFSAMASIIVLVVGRHCTNLPPNSTPAVAGLLFTRVSLEPLIALRTQMEEEPKLHAQLVVVIWAMFSKGRDLRRLQMNDTVSTVFRSSFCPRRLHLLPFEGL